MKQTIATKMIKKQKQFHCTIPIAYKPRLHPTLHTTNHQGEKRLRKKKMLGHISVMTKHSHSLEAKRSSSTTLTEVDRF